MSVGADDDLPHVYIFFSWSTGNLAFSPTEAMPWKEVPCHLCSTTFRIPPKPIVLYTSSEAITSNHSYPLAHAPNPRNLE